MKTFIPKMVVGSDRAWHIVDAQDMILGKLSTKIASILRGKDKPTFTPHLDTGDYVIVINAEKVKLTGKKLEDKMYYKHSGYIGHLKSMSAREMFEKKPTQVIELAVKGMIPHTKLRDDMLKRLKIVVGSEHQYAAQQPKELKIAA